jgi:hypothetical protein
MLRDPDHSAGRLEDENTGGILTGFLADEEEIDRRALWRLGSWGVASVGAVIIAMFANQSQIGWRREQVAAADLVRQSQQIQLVVRESQNEARRLAAAVETLGGDRDRLYSRVTVLEQGLDSVTGAIARQGPAATAAPQSPAQAPAPAPPVSPVAATAAATAEKPRADAPVPEPAPATVSSVGQAASNTPATSLMASKSIMAPPDAAAGRWIEPEKSANTAAAAPGTEVVASAPPDVDAEPESAEAASPKVAVQRTEFGVDIGGANSVGGLRALWRGLLKSRSNAVLTTLRPIMVIREGSTGLGMQLRLVAGPINDAAAAAKICAGLIENERPCETTVFDGQRLAMKADEPSAATKPADARPALAPKPAAAKPVARRRGSSKRVVNDEAAKKPESSTFSSLFGKR